MRSSLGSLHSKQARAALRVEEFFKPAFIAEMIFFFVFFFFPENTP